MAAFWESGAEGDSGSHRFLIFRASVSLSSKVKSPIRYSDEQKPRNEVRREGREAWPGSGQLPEIWLQTLGVWCSVAFWVHF